MASGGVLAVRQVDAWWLPAAGRELRVDVQLGNRSCRTDDPVGLPPMLTLLKDRPSQLASLAPATRLIAADPDVHPTGAAA